MVSLVALVVGQSPPAQAQADGTVSGVVTDSDGAPVEGARVTLVRGRVVGWSGPDGRFLLARVPAGPDTLRVSAIGFQPRGVAVEIPPDGEALATVVLTRVVQRLPEIRVAEEAPPYAPRLVDVERRRKGAFGVFLDEEDIRSRFPLKPHDLLRGIAGIRVSERVGQQVIQFTRCLAGQNRIAVWIDGAKAIGDSPEAAMGRVAVRDIVAMEVYRGVAQIPAEFLDDACGVIVIWTQ